LHYFKYKLVVNEEVISYSEINVVDQVNYSYDLFAPRLEVVCTYLNDLDVGQHHVTLMYYNVVQFNWIPLTQNLIYVDEDGNVTDAFN